MRQDSQLMEGEAFWTPTGHNHFSALIKFQKLYWLNNDVWPLIWLFSCFLVCDPHHLYNKKINDNENHNNDQDVATQLCSHLRESSSQGNVSWSLSMTIHLGWVSRVLQQQSDYTAMSPCSCPAQCAPPTEEVQDERENHRRCKNIWGKMREEEGGVAWMDDWKD